jgi:hypothetical protein
MAPRARRTTTGTLGMVFFNKGVADFQVREFLKKNNLPETTTVKQLENHTAVLANPNTEYTIPDDFYVWFSHSE